ncbi:MULTISPECIES: hypothetical protein [Pseudoalteromonas]|uniref:Uncharacterized protein n=1 Tax=Pseudoalteromonas amylolytica TaxID=1859457 RepID=A0A1S1N0U8_9GAMM|nr:MULTISPECIES: hypothetical protein [Pseudoalteromonas]OHU92285.1 hypothetical protein BFC16_00010 [Pseudoalteromonas sp. JW3]OHU93265.1 hypothetical protein BET10_00010 [Pseudoalteromonas amylolytica]
MLPKISKIKYIESNPNSFHWDLTGVSGLEFEIEINNFIKRELQEKIGPFGPIRMKVTSKTGDRGKDAVIIFTESFVLFGINFQVPRDKKFGTIHVEIKKRNRSSLSLDDFSSSITQSNADGSNPDYLLLITNTYLSPNSVFHAEKDLSAKKCQFKLVDKFSLAKSLIVREHPLSNSIKENLPEYELNISYCLLTEWQAEDLVFFNTDEREEQKKDIYLYIQFHNYSDRKRVIDINLQSDINWILSSSSSDDVVLDSSIKVHLSPKAVIAKKLKLTQKGLSALDEFRLLIKSDGLEKFVGISDEYASFSFDPPIFGVKHIEVKNELLSSLHCSSKSKLVHLYGGAGVGKSKILKEVERLSEGSHVNFMSFELRPKKESDIYKGICKKSAKEIKKELPFNISNFEKKLKLLCEESQEHLAIIIEDVHHASKEFIDFIKKYIESDFCYYTNLTLIVTGRDDNTFFNESYYSLISLIEDKEEGHFSSYKIYPWSDKDCEHFIRYTVNDIPEFSLRSIMKISGNTPFGAVQSMQYLLDLDIVEIVNRNTLGILNAEFFASRCSLPDEIKSLLNLRVENAVNFLEKNICHLLSAMSFIGMSISEGDALALFNEVGGFETLCELERRGFLVNEGGKVKFSHENFQIYFKEALEDKDIAYKAAVKVLSEESVYLKLSEFDIGLLKFLAQDFEASFSFFYKIWEEAKNIENISSIDLPSYYFDFFDALIMTSLELRKDIDVTRKLCLIETYLALHNKPLSIALSVTEKNLALLKENRDKNSEFCNYIIKVEQLKAHILLNMGYISSAQKIMLEISAISQLHEEIEKDTELMFDLYDRLQNVYHQFNHKELFIKYSELSKRVAMKVGDPKLKSLVISSRTKEYLFDDPKRYLEETKKATEWSVMNASSRHICHMKLNLLIAQLIYNEGKENLYLEAIASLKSLLKESILNGYAFSITRSQFAIAVAYTLLGLDKRENRRLALHFVNKALDTSIKFGNGFFYWQLHNLKALIELNQPDCNIGTVEQHFSTALFYLAKQGLCFLGALDSLSPNLSVISNIVRFYDLNYSDSRTYNFLKNLSYYNKGLHGKDEELRELLESVRKYQLIGRKKPLISPFIEPNTGYLLSIR